MSNYTPWFSALRVKPVRKGFYEVKSRVVCANKRYWDGSAWRLNLGGLQSIFGLYDNDKWRGLAKDPNA